jgi:hypothetical protein
MYTAILCKQGYRFFFFTKEEPRMHVHVYHTNGEAKFWLEPHLETALNIGLSEHELTQAESLIKLHQQDIENAWHEHFRS